MGYTIADVCEAWKQGKAKHTSSKSVSTSGSDLYSYQMRIGKTDNEGNKIAFKSYSLYVSHTTNQHIRISTNYADKWVEAESLGFGYSRYDRYVFPVESSEIESEESEMSTDKLIIIKYKSGEIMLATKNKGTIFKQYKFKSVQAARHCIRYLTPFCACITEQGTLNLYGYETRQFHSAFNAWINIDEEIRNAQSEIEYNKKMIEHVKAQMRNLK